MLLKFPKYFLVTLLIVGVLILNGCSGEDLASNATSPTSTTAQANTDVTAPANLASDVNKEGVPGMFEDLLRLEGKATVVMTVNGSPITIELDGENAPITAGNFVELVKKGFYDGLTFHRVVRQPQPFVVQGGDPKGNGTGGYVDKKTGVRRAIPLEITPKDADEPIYSKTFKQARINKPPELQHKSGAVAMARSQNPDSASSQFYFALADLAFLDGDYAVFGYVTEGMDVVNKIQQGDKIENAKVTAGVENLKNAD